MIEVKDIKVCYGDEVAVDDLSLTVDKNTTCAVIGPSGCGKTTLLYSLAGLIEPEKGEIYIDGQRLNGVRSSTGLILQSFGLLPWKTVWNNLAFTLKARGISKGQVKDKVSFVLNSLGLLDLSDKYPEELSGGQKQRVAIGRTLLLEPDLLLMDEPSSALDAITKEHMQNLVLDIYKKNKITLVIVTHNIEEAVFLGKKIVVMKEGHVRHIVENPYFGAEDLRDNMEFYKMCLEVRKMLNE